MTGDTIEPLDPVRLPDRRVEVACKEPPFGHVRNEVVPFANIHGSPVDIHGHSFSKFARRNDILNILPVENMKGTHAGSEHRLCVLTVPRLRSNDTNDRPVSPTLMSQHKDASSDRVHLRNANGSGGKRTAHIPAKDRLLHRPLQNNAVGVRSGDDITDDPFANRRIDGNHPIRRRKDAVRIAERTGKRSDDIRAWASLLGASGNICRNNGKIRFKHHIANSADNRIKPRSVGKLRPPRPDCDSIQKILLDFSYRKVCNRHRRSLKGVFQNDVTIPRQRTITIALPLFKVFQHVCKNHRLLME